MFMHREVTPPVSGQEHASQTVIKALSFILLLSISFTHSYIFLPFHMIVLVTFLNYERLLAILFNKKWSLSKDIISGVSIFANPYQLQ